MTNETKPIIALTFDDGPNTTITVKILDLLEKYHITGSFFLIGRNINEESIPVVKRAHSMGCEINNHTKTHPFMSKLTPEEIRAEIAYVTDKITEIIGEPPHFFRPPFIDVNDTMYENISLPFICGVGCNDWELSATAEDRVTILRRDVSDGNIVLLHDFEHNEATVEALEIMIPEWIERGFEFVTVSELFRRKGVTPTTANKELYTLVSAK